MPVTRIASQTSESRKSRELRFIRAPVKVGFARLQFCNQLQRSLVEILIQDMPCDEAVMRDPLLYFLALVTHGIRAPMQRPRRPQL